MEVQFNVHYEFGSLKFFLKKLENWMTFPLPFACNLLDELPLSFREKSEITGMHPTLHNY